MSHPDDQLHSEIFSLDEVEDGTLGGLFTDEPEPAKPTFGQPAAPARRAAAQREPQLEQPNKRKGLRGRFADGIALAKQAEAREADESDEPLIDIAPSPGETAKPSFGQPDSTPQRPAETREHQHEEPAKRKGLRGRFAEGIALAKQAEVREAGESDEPLIDIAPTPDEPPSSIARPTVDSATGAAKGPFARLKEGLALARKAEARDRGELEHIAPQSDEPLIEIASPGEPEETELDASDTSIRGRFKFAWDLAKRDSAAKDAGLDVSPPKRAHAPKPAVAAAAADEDDPFLKLLRPVDEAEIERLQQDAFQEEAVVALMDRARNRGVLQQRLGMFGGLLCLALFMYKVGERYLTHNLANAPVPSWLIHLVHNVGLSGKLSHNVLTGAIFVLGVLLPFVAAKILADGFALGLRGATDKSLLDLVLAAAACGLGGFMLVYLTLLQPVPALLMGVAWGAMSFVAGLVDPGRRD